MATKEKAEKEGLNVYQKLAIARVNFAEKGLKKSGENLYAKFKYFELAEIKAYSNSIFQELGLLDVFELNTENATVTIVNCEKIDEKIVFSFAINIDDIEAKMGQDKQSRGMQPVQRLGSVSTYLERYLICKALGISDKDIVDGLEPDIKNDTKPKANKSNDGRIKLMNLIKAKNLDIKIISAKFNLNKATSNDGFTTVFNALIGASEEELTHFRGAQNE